MSTLATTFNPSKTPSIFHLVLPDSRKSNALPVFLSGKSSMQIKMSTKYWWDGADKGNRSIRIKTCPNNFSSSSSSPMALGLFSPPLPIISILCRPSPILALQHPLIILVNGVYPSSSGPSNRSSPFLRILPVLSSAPFRPSAPTRRLPIEILSV